MNLTVIIANYNGEELLPSCLNSLASGLKHVPKSKVIVVDNGSSDRSIELLKSSKHKFNDLKVIQNERNLGFAKAVNQAARASLGKYLLILNNDCLIEEDLVVKLLTHIRKHPKIIATQPVVMKDREIENIGYLVDTFVGRANVIKDLNLLAGLTKKSNRYVYGLSATCLLIRRDVFIQIGMFDESFHSYLEDVDLFVRLNKKAYQFSPMLTAFCKHRHMATSSKMGIYKQKQDLKNWLMIIFKNFSLFHIIQHFPSLFIERLRNLNGLIKAVIINKV